MGTMTTLTPMLKQKVDELFLHWFSEVETQAQLRKDLAAICGEHGLERPVSPINLSNTNSINTRPSSPPIPPGSPTATPRSPRRRTSSNVSRRSLVKSLRLSIHEERRGNFYPGCAKNIKQFYFPYGKPDDSDISKDLKDVKLVFDNLKNNSAKLEDFAVISKTLHLPLYWKYPLFSTCGGVENGVVSYQMFANTWKRLSSTYHDDASKLFHMLAKDNQSFLQFGDFEALLQDIINTHPGLRFLVDAPEFHSRYILTVISRIFYSINRSWNGRITLSELRRSNFLQVLRRLEEEEDINQIVEYFSYEHFYVIYCKFWELDTDHDMVINKQDLSRYSNGALSKCMLERLFDGCVTRGSSLADGTMSYIDFVWFILSEVDKSTPTGIEYWFRCMDLNGDGVLTMYELQYFYEDQMKKMIDLGMETLAFNDCLCQMLDLVKPATPNVVTLHDIKDCKMAPIFFDTFFNLDKWLDHEQKDPLQMLRDENDPESTWDRYVNEEYELLVAEEGGGDDDDYDFEDEMTSQDELLKPIGTNFDDLGPRWSIISAINDDDETFY